MLVLIEGALTGLVFKLFAFFTDYHQEQRLSPYNMSAFSLKIRIDGGKKPTPPGK